MTNESAAEKPNGKVKQRQRYLGTRKPGGRGCGLPFLTKGEFLEAARRAEEAAETATKRAAARAAWAARGPRKQVPQAEKPPH